MILVQTHLQIAQFIFWFTYVSLTVKNQRFLNVYKTVSLEIFDLNVYRNTYLLKHKQMQMEMLKINDTPDKDIVMSHFGSKILSKKSVMKI